MRTLVILAALAATSAAKDRKCTCAEGHASYLYLRSPRSAPADPDPCPATYEGIHPRKNPPKAWNDACWQSPRMACFLRRHAASWRITCSLCTKKRCCPYPNWHNCPECHGPAGKQESEVDLVHFKKVLAQQKKIGGRFIEMAMNPRYIVVSDLRQLKIITASGAPRPLRQHEMLHLYIQRAEQARADWTKVFGHPAEYRSMMILVRSKSTQQAFSGVHFGSPNTNLLYGGSPGKQLGGYAANGFCIDGRDDDSLHFRCRHMIGHLCVSTYAGGGTSSKYLPQWIFRGAAHWLSKLHPRARNFSTYCAYEGVTVSGSGKRWDSRAAKIAARGPSRDPVERMLQASTAKQANYSLHVRGWSWFDIFTREEPEPFVRFVQLLRSAKEPRLAAKEAFGQPPEVVDQRWRERVLGKRRHVTATNKEKEKETDVDAATRRELLSISRETDIQLLAGRIRGLDRCQNVRTARLLIGLLDTRDSDRVREVIAMVLARTDDEKVREFLRGKGFQRAGNLGRAILCRVFGETKDAGAVGLLRTSLADSYWLVKANAARAVAQLRDKDSITTVAKLAASNANLKVRIAAMDALGIFGADAKDTTILFERNIMNRRWQVKVATCDAFRAIGSTKAVDMLIGRIDAEGGRVHDAIRQALRELTGMDRDWRAEMWRKWWKKAKQWQDLEKRMKEQLEKEKRTPKPKTPRGRYATTKKPPTYYGIKVYARAVAYVLDTSASMQQGFRVSPQWEQRLGHKFTATSRIGVCKQELAQSIKELDPRTRINLVFFNDRVRTWKPAPVPVGSMGDNAISAIKNVRPAGQTNYYGALRLVLGMAEEGAQFSPRLKDTPDTVFFLTDGTATDGEITKSDELLAWFAERNRFARLRVHVIAMGTTGVDIEFLSRLAREHDGVFIHMTGTH